MGPAQAQLRRSLTSARRTFKVAAVAAVAALLGSGSVPPTLLEQVRLLGELRVVTRNSPTAYYLGVEGPEGPEFDLVTRFAERLAVPVRWTIVRSGAEALDEVVHNRAHIAAAGIIINEERRGRVAFGPVYHEITQQVVYRLGSPVPQTAADLGTGRTEVVAGSTHARRLADLARDNPGLSFEEVPNLDQLDLLARVSSGAADFSVVDSSEFAIGRHFHPDLRVAFELEGRQPIAWALNTRDDSLLERVRDYFGDLHGDDGVDTILARYYGPAEGFDYVYSLNFIRHVQERLPALRPYFEEAAAATGFDWRLLAAIGYQESKWDPDAVSRTGVRGIMMLTLDTASRVGVADRADARSSIVGGAAYLREVLEKIPARIAEPDRTWLALAAYNVGFGHLEDARILAQRDGANPDSWQDVRKYLPLLAQERWYTQLRRGYARGWEPVHFVRNVRRYLDVLVWMTGAPERDVRLAARTPDEESPPGR